MKKLLYPTLIAAAVFGAPFAAHAFPAFSQKEKKPCLYCHVNPSGGGKRNATGLWYKSHALSFAGYTPEKANTAAKLTASPAPKPKATPVPKKPVAKKPVAKPAAKKPWAGGDTRC